MKKTLLKIQYKLKTLKHTLPVEQHKEVEEIENLVVFLAGKIRMGELREEIMSHIPIPTTEFEQEIKS